MQSKARDLKKESCPQREFFTQGTQGIFFYMAAGAKFSI